ncbi:hypothetical protein HAX54_046097 [Datura stramonium]|uniref:Fungal lipase-type domain-containing protein n=1 Tax=Datura stramonium TaxID=4076 RepID=A0ABS8WIN2_DATST|nr:hypothetical protein [Datura stramonium]
MVLLHVGEELVLDHKTSPFLKDIQSHRFPQFGGSPAFTCGFHGKEFGLGVVISVNDSPYPITKLQSNGNKFHNDEEAKLANKWRDIHGRNNWEDMLEPIDPLLRAELIRYGDMTQACYDAYNLDRSYQLEITQMPDRDPTIRIEAGFLKIYRRKDDKCNLCKFSTREQVLNEVKRLIVSRYSDEEVSITITGHSLGSALAIINAYDIAEIGLNVREDGRVIPLCVFSFSGPRVGNIRFKQRLEGFGVKVLSSKL